MDDNPRVLRIGPVTFDVDTGDIDELFDLPDPPDAIKLHQAFLSLPEDQQIFFLALLGAHDRPLIRLCGLRPTTDEALERRRRMILRKMARLTAEYDRVKKALTSRLHRLTHAAGQAQRQQTDRRNELVHQGLDKGMEPAAVWEWLRKEHGKLLKGRPARRKAPDSAPGCMDVKAMMLSYRRWPRRPKD
jgi:hypothetical protein